MAGLEVRGARVRFGGPGGFDAVAGVDLAVADGTVTAVLGPSGCGKSTLLRAIAGLEPLTAGIVRLAGADLAGIPVHRRGIGLMFQDYLLFPHLDVAGNVAFGLRMGGLAPAAVRARVAEVLEMVGLMGYGGRGVASLSGGEQQRVALARSLAPSPRLLMLDEPLGALDRTLRERLLGELRELFTGLGIAILYVTHDQEEAFAVADRVAVMRAGVIEQEGPAEEVWAAPRTAFVARFLGFSNLAEAVVAGGVAVTPWGSLPLRAPDGALSLVLRPTAFRPAPDGPIAGVVSARTFRGDHWLLTVAVTGAPPLEVAASWRPLPAVGEAIRLAVAADDVVVLTG